MLAAVAALSFDAVGYVVGGLLVAAWLADELGLVHDAVRQVVDCWLLRTFCQLRAVSHLRIELAITRSGRRSISEWTELGLSEG